MACTDLAQIVQPTSNHLKTKITAAIVVMHCMQAHLFVFSLFLETLKRADTTCHPGSTLLPHPLNYLFQAMAPHPTKPMPAVPSSPRLGADTLRGDGAARAIRRDSPCCIQCVQWMCFLHFQYTQTDCRRRNMQHGLARSLDGSKSHSGRTQHH